MAVGGRPKNKWQVKIILYGLPKRKKKMAGYNFFLFRALL